MPNPRVGNIIKVSSGFRLSTGPQNIDAYPIRWGVTPADAAMFDPTTFPKGDGVSTLGYMNFICLKGGDINFHFQKLGSPTLFVGATVTIDPMPLVTGQSAVFEGIVS